MKSRISILAIAASMAMAAQDPQEGAAAGALKTTEPKPGAIEVKAGTRLPLSMINSVSTKQTAEGDRLYLETVFPIVLNSRIVIPPGSYVAGTVTQVKRPGRIKGRAELYVRFDSLTLPNGVTRDFRARIGALDGRATEELDKEEGKLKGQGNKGGDARTIGETAAQGAQVGAIAGAIGGRPGAGVGIGAASGAAAGLIGVLLTRGPDAILARGTTVDMVLDRDLWFEESELDFGGFGQARRPVNDGSGPLPSQKTQDAPARGLPRIFFQSQTADATN